MSQTCDEGAIRGLDTTIILHPLTAREGKVPGVVNGQLPGFTTELIDYDPLDKKIAGKLLGSSAYTDTQFTSYMIRKSQMQTDLRVYAEQRVQFRDLWYMYDDVHGDFWALDLATDPCGVLGIAGFAPQSYGRNDLVQIQFNLSVNGAGGYYEYHTDALSYEIDAGVVTATDGDFIARGFNNYDPDQNQSLSVILETGDQSNPYYYALVEAVTATTLTLKDKTLTVAALEGKIHGAIVGLSV